jgi:hypothetical protein
MMNKNYDKQNMTKNKRQKGSVMILNVLLFLVISLAVLFSLSIPITSMTINSRAHLDIKKTFIIANSAGEEALYKINRGKMISEEEILFLLDGEVLISVDENIVNIESKYNNTSQKLIITTTEEGPHFDYNL